MKNLTLEIILLILVINTKINSQLPEYNWSKTITGSLNQVGQIIISDKSGNVYTAGYFCGMADFDPGPLSYYLYSDGTPSTYISKLDSTGKFVWAIHLDGNCVPTSMIFDHENNLLLCGYYGSWVDFNPDINENANYSSKGSSDIFIANFFQTGKLNWVKSIGSFGPDAANSIKTDNDKNIYLAGGYTGNVDFENGNSILNTDINGKSNGFIVKWDKDWNLIWFAPIVSDAFANVIDLTIDRIGNVYAVGSYSGNILFEQNEKPYKIPSNGDVDGFILKINYNTHLEWIHTLGGKSSDSGFSIKTDSLGFIYTNGVYKETIDLDPGIGVSSYTSNGGSDIFILKLDSLGKLIWSKTIGGDNDDTPSALAFDKTGFIYLTGLFSKKVNFGTENVPKIINSKGKYDNFILCLSKDGNLLWVNSIGRDSSYCRGISIYIDDNFTIYTTGIFYGKIDFNPNFTNELINSTGNYDAFILKLKQSSNKVEITKINKESLIVIYPNPSKGIINIRIKGSQGHEKVKIYDSVGKLFLEKNLIKEQNQIELLGADEGIYIFKFYSKEQIISTNKVIIQ